MSGIITAIIVLGAIGCIGAVALYVIAKKFHVDEDPRIARVEELLPGANCGGCGRKGCHDFAVCCVESDTLEGLFCPSAGQQGMDAIAQLLDRVADSREQYVAVVRCGGTAETKAPLHARYVGAPSCAVMNMTAGNYQCANSCLGCGDCTRVCRWQAIRMVTEGEPSAPDSHNIGSLPVVDTDRCTGCGMCVTNCPRHIIELRLKGPRGRRVWVACSNCQKGAITRQQCKVGCIACGKCVKTCPFEAITIVDNHAYIDPAKCKACGKCIGVCPTKAIHSVNITIRPKNETDV